jgi:sugar-specific transcriptional regulator TrmB
MSEEAKSGQDSSIKQVLELVGLGPDEIKTYFKITGRGPVMLGEIAILSRISEERAQQIANNLLGKGLVREIPGKTPHYMALPPYAALLNQIQQFREVVENIQQRTPQLLEERFKSIEQQTAKLQQLEDYRNHIHQMKQNLPNQIKNQFSKFEDELEQVKKFQEIKQFILNLREIVPEDITKEFERMEGRLEVIKTEISNAFETQFRVGALKKMAEKIVSNIMYKEFNQIVDEFKGKIVNTTQGMLDEVIGQLGSLSDAAGDISTGLDNTFNDIESGLRETLEDLDKRISTVYNDITGGIQDLKAMFQKEIYETLQKDIITNILNQLQLSESTMREFWERAKKASLLTFKDVWFVRSAEGMKAQINDSISRVKMRFHIIAPRLEDIDMVAIKDVKRHVNVRISTNFDMANEDHKQIIESIEEFPNIDIRYYPRENLWSINKDFEEVIVCIVAPGMSREDMEIAGMGSILEEHVKLFAAVLEDVWIQSKKLDHVEATQTIERPKSGDTLIRPSEYKELRDFEEQEKVTGKVETEISEPSSETQETEIDTTPPESDIQEEPIQQESISRPVPITQEINTPSEQSKTEEGPTKGKSLAQQFATLENKMNKITAVEISKELSSLKQIILDQKGYSSVLKQINLSISMYKNVGGNLNQTELDELKKKIRFWKSKLGV